jgi:predicted RNase H-like nuclease (RuvC/YqgF family)
MKDATLKKVKSLEEAQEVLNTERDTLKIHIASLEREVETAKRAADFERKKMDELARERDILNKLRTQVNRQSAPCTAQQYRGSLC